MDLLDAVIARAGKVRPEKRHGRTEYNALCPYHADEHLGSFSFNDATFYCFSCGAKGTLRQLAAQLGLDTAAPLPIRPRPKAPEPEIVRPWQQDPDYWKHYLPLPDHARAYYHGRGIDDASIERWHLGWGRLPHSRCQYRRYVLPVLDGARLVALKGRFSPECDCSDCEYGEAGTCGPKRGKWLASAGSGAQIFGTETLEVGKVVVVAEAPFAAILTVQTSPHLAAVAPTIDSVSEDVWAKWAARIASYDPPFVLLWFDHDEGGEKMGAKGYAALQAAGLKVRRWRWNVKADERRDLADEIAGGKVVPIAQAKPRWADAYI